MSNVASPGDSPEKIPDYIMVGVLREEIGKLSSYVEELEDELQKYKTITTEELREIKRTEIYKKQNGEKQQLEIKIRQLRRDNQDLIIKLNKQ